jgi:hypothetical protein
MLNPCKEEIYAKNTMLHQEDINDSLIPRSSSRVSDLHFSDLNSGTLDCLFR